MSKLIEWIQWKEVELSSSYYENWQTTFESEAIIDINWNYILEEDSVELRWWWVIHRDDESLMTDAGGICFLEWDDNFVYCEDVWEYSHISNAYYVYLDTRRRNWEYRLNLYDATSIDGRYYDDNVTWYCSDCEESFLEWDSCNCDDYDDNDDVSSLLDWYHSSGDEAKWRARMPEKWDILVWLELERAKYPEYTAVQHCIDRWWRAESDCSVRWWEYITPILHIDEALDEIQENIGILNAPIDDNCGWHIHISIVWKTSEELYEYFRWWRPLLWGLYPARVRNSYCSRHGNRYDHSVDVWVRSHTVEIRIFPWAENLKTIEFRLALIRYMIKRPFDDIEKALKHINTLKWLKEIIDVLDIVYGTVERKMKAIERILKFYSEWTEEINEAVIQRARRICELKDSEKNKKRVVTNESEV